jgi:hypothetical protein
LLRISLAATLAAALALPAFAFTDYYADKKPPAADKPADPAPAANQKQRFHATMDRVFGSGRWRETSGWRSREREDQLRREGAGTVRPGEVSHHSMGTPEAPGAYDVVVPGMSNAAAAARLKTESGDFSRVLAERAHGPEGQHLHLEPNYGRVSSSEAGSGASALRPTDDDNVYLRVVNGRRNPALAPLGVIIHRP